VTRLVDRPWIEPVHDLNGVRDRFPTLPHLLYEGRYLGISLGYLSAESSDAGASRRISRGSRPALLSDDFQFASVAPGIYLAGSE
jgi:hypothetical protein